MESMECTKYCQRCVGFGFVLMSKTLEQQHRTQIVHKFFQVCNFRSNVADLFPICLFFCIRNVFSQINTSLFFSYFFCIFSFLSNLQLQLAKKSSTIGPIGPMCRCPVEWNGMESMECNAVEWNGMQSFWVISSTFGYFGFVFFHFCANSKNKNAHRRSPPDFCFSSHFRFFVLVFVFCSPAPFLRDNS